MFSLKRFRPLDLAITFAVVLVVGLGAYLGYSIWQSSRSVEQATPAGRTIESIQAAIKKNPGNIPLRLQLAGAYMQLGNTKDALKEYKVILEADDDNVLALGGVAIIALRDKEFKTAEGYLRKAVEVLEPETGMSRDSQLEEVYYLLGTALMEQKKYEDAAGHFKAALRIKRDNSMSHYLLAVCLRELGLKDAYRESLGNALMFDPKHPEANYDYGRVLLADGDRAGAAEHFRRAAEAAPKVEAPVEALEKMGTAEEHVAAAESLAVKDRGKAIIEARIAVAIDPKSADAQLLLGRLYEQAGNDAKAKSAYSKVLNIDAKNKDAKAGLERVSD